MDGTRASAARAALIAAAALACWGVVASAAHPSNVRRAGAWSSDPRAGARPHDFHVVYGRMAIQDDVIEVRLRFFADDLTEGLRWFAHEPDFRLAVDLRSDSLVTAYVNERFRVVARTHGGEAPIAGAIRTSGEEVDGRESVWWYVFGYRAPAPVVGLDVRDELLTELFDDQRNILRIQHFPSEKQETFYLTADDPQASFRL